MTDRFISSRLLLGTFAAAFTLAIAGRVSAESRVWTDTHGKIVNAEFAGLEAETVNLRTADGKVFAVPLSRLTAADQEVARKLSSQPAERPAVASIANIPVPANTLESAAIIDKLVEANLVAQKMKPNPMLTDDQFVRRIYLDVAGRIPNYDETITFLQEKGRDKRGKLIKTLLTSKGHFSHLFNYLADVFRLKMRVTEVVGGASYIGWVRDCIEANKPYDEMVRQMLTASGVPFDNPASGYLLRDTGMPLENLSATMQVFHGLDLSCAQCHDHPFNNWTQMQFYKLAAYFGDTSTVLDAVERNELFPKSKGSPTDRVEAELKAKGEYSEPDRTLRNTLGVFRFRVRDNPKHRSLKLPVDYRYADGKPGDVVHPSVIYGPPPDLSKFDSKRQAFAKWLTDDDRFAITIANRLWKRAFGMGVAEPVISVENYEENPNLRLLKYLGAEMKRLKFDIRAFEEIIYNTQTYQRVAFAGVAERGGPYHFPGPLLRRMTAEQVWDSFLTMIIPDVDYFYRRRDYKELDRLLAGKNFDEIPAFEAREVSNKAGELDSSTGGLYGWPRKPEEENFSVYFDDRVQAWRIINTVFIRASEFVQPTYPGHFLFNMGASDRLLLDGSTTTGSVPIVMALMNSEGTTNLTKTGSRILEAIDKGRAVGPKLETAFLSVLNRMPNAQERSHAYKAIARDGGEGFKNVVWSLINTREFLFIQ